jgi:hypothetical protein
MKKFLVLFVSAAALAAGSAFALDLPDALKIPGLSVKAEVKTGLRVDGVTYTKDDGDAPGHADGTSKEGDSISIDPSVYALSDDVGDGVPFRADLILEWTQGNVGLKTTFRYQPNSKEGNLSAGQLAQLSNTVNTAFVYANLFDSKAKVTLGKDIGKGWTTPLKVGSDDTDGFGLNGLRLEVKPIDGLNFGAAYGTGDLFNKAWVEKKTPQFTDKTKIGENDQVRKFVVGAKYATDNFSATLALLANIWGVDNTQFDGHSEGITEAVATPKKGTSHLLIGAKFAPIEPLTINFTGAITGLGSKSPEKAHKDETDNDLPNASDYYKEGKYNPYWAFLPKLEVAYAVNDALSAGLVVKDFYFADGYYLAESKADDPKDEGLGLLFPITFNPYVAYAINDDITASLDLNLKINSGGSDRFGFGIKPKAEFSLGSGATFVVYDEITFYGASKAADDKEWAEKHNGAANAALTKPALDTKEPEKSVTPYGYTTNALQFDFVWKF